MKMTSSTDNNKTNQTSLTTHTLEILAYVHDPYIIFPRMYMPFKRQTLYRSAHHAKLTRNLYIAGLCMYAPLLRKTCVHICNY